MKKGQAVRMAFQFKTLKHMSAGMELELFSWSHMIKTRE